MAQAARAPFHVTRHIPPENPCMIGKTVAHYRITEMIGAGGMGEVFRAADSKLGRDVALKMLPAAFAQDAERMARFQREAQVLASLNHPNIGAIYGLEESEDSHFLVLEIIEGPTLYDRLVRGPVPVNEALEIARQIAEAVEFAHESGVVHRDLKPSNVKVTEHGRVKVLDFGLAKALEDPAEAASGMSDPAASPTISPSISPTLQSPITGALTGANVILGTAAYMSPEQARGKRVDKRADIWAFGAMLWEMLTGRRLFDGDTVSDILAAVLRKDPEWDDLPESTPPHIRRLLRRCLARNPKDRLRDIGDARLVLEDVLAGDLGEASAPEAAPAPRSPLSRILVGVVALAAVIVAFVVGGRLAGHDDAGQMVPRLTFTFPEEHRVADYHVAPRGGLVGWIARPRDAASEEADLSHLYVRSIEESGYRRIEGTANLRHFAFAPDHRHVLAIVPETPKSSRYRLVRIPLDGDSPSLALIDFDPSWLPDLYPRENGDVWVANTQKEWIRISETGSVSSLELHFEGAWTPSVPHGHMGALPDGKHVLQSVETWDGNGFERNIILIDIETGETKVVIPNGGSSTWSPTGHILFTRGTSLLAIPFDPGTLETSGGPVALVDDLRIGALWQDGNFELSLDGVLMYRDGGLQSGRQLVWMDPDLETWTPWMEEKMAFERAPVASPDGKYVAVVFADQHGTFDLWISELDRPGFRKFREQQGWDVIPDFWTPDGRLVFQVSNADSATYRTVLPDGTGEQVLFGVDYSNGGYVLTGITPEGDYLLDHVFEGRRVIQLVSLSGRGPEYRTIQEDAWSSRLSPDHQWLAYGSDISGNPEVYVRRWLGEGRLGPEIKVSSGGGLALQWYQSADGRLLLWYGRQGRFYRVDATTEATLRSSEPELFSTDTERLGGSSRFSDGRILMLLQAEDEGAIGDSRIVLNWDEELERVLR